MANKSNSNGNNDFAEKCKYKNNIINILRLERHDYFNHLQVLYGLLQLKRYDKLNGQINKMLKELGKDNSLLSVKEPYLLEVLYNGKLNARENNIDLKIEIENPLYSGKTATQRRKIEFAKHLEFFLSVLMDNINGLIQKNKKISINIGSSSKGKTYGLITYPGIIYDDILMDLKNKNDI
ncbi:MAG TPA: hypothetical protein GX526_01130, partial [Thermoanaerobacterales bacterium]|nr:hypothetical protein [Thermoanaerobacterales bacterium]